MFICKYCLLIQRCIRIDVLFIYLLLKCFKVMCTFRKIVQYMNANVNGLITIVILIHLSKIAIAWLLQQNDGVYCVVMQRMWNALKSSFLYSFSLVNHFVMCVFHAVFRLTQPCMYLDMTVVSIIDTMSICCWLWEPSDVAGICWYMCLIS